MSFCQPCPTLINFRTKIIVILLFSSVMDKAKKPSTPRKERQAKRAKVVQPYPEPDIEAQQRALLENGVKSAEEELEASEKDLKEAVKYYVEAGEPASQRGIVLEIAKLVIEGQNILSLMKSNLRLFGDNSFKANCERSGTRMLMAPGLAIHELGAQNLFKSLVEDARENIKKMQDLLKEIDRLEMIVKSAKALAKAEMVKYLKGKIDVAEACKAIKWYLQCHHEILAKQKEYLEEPQTPTEIDVDATFKSFLEKLNPK